MNLDTGLTLHKNELKIDRRSKYKMQNYKTFRKTFKENLWDLGLGKEFSDWTPKARFIKGKS